MESAGFRHRRSPSSDRLLGIFTSSPPSSAAAGGGGSASGSGGELIEAEVFWTNDFSEPSQDHGDSSVAGGAFPCQNRHRSGFAEPQKSGILAVLPDSDRCSQVLCRKASISPSSSVTMSTPVIPRPPTASHEREYSQSVAAGKLRHQSAPMNVPVLAKAMAKRTNFEVFQDDDEEEDDKVLPPHEIVVKGSGVSPKTTFSVLEGVGRTLKGRDLRQVLVVVSYAYKNNGVNHFGNFGLLFSIYFRNVRMCKWEIWVLPGFYRSVNYLNHKILYQENIFFVILFLWVFQLDWERAYNNVWIMMADYAVVRVLVFLDNDS